MDFINELEKLSLTVDFMTKEQAHQVDKLITSIISSVSEPLIIDVLWARAAQEGNIVLEPLDFLGRKHKGRGDALRYILRPGQTGVWAVAYSECRKVWVKDVRQGSSELRDEVSGKSFDPERLDIYRETDSIMVVPLKIEDVLYGLYSVEWRASERLSRTTLDLIEELARPLARICWKVENLRIDLRQTSEAIDLFGESINRARAAEPLSPQRTGFIVRPFDPQFDAIENYLRNFFQKKRIHVQKYEHTPGRGVVVSEILRKIKASHFGIADITGSTSNVLFELGALLVSEKRCLLLRREDDDKEVPFDIKPFHYYSYSVKNGRIVHGTSRLLDAVLEKFVKELETDPGFSTAKPVGAPLRIPGQSRGS